MNVSGGILLNDHLTAVDASFQRDVDISGMLIVSDDVSFHQHMSALDDHL